MSTTTVVIGYDHRTWVTFEIKDVTPEEFAVIEGDEAEALAFLGRLEKEGRLDEINEDSEDCPDIFGNESSALIDYNQED